MATLTPPVDSGDHSDGPDDAPLALVVYGDFQCPYCTAAQSMIARVRDRLGDRLRFTFRHLPLAAHPEAQIAGEASEAAAAQGAFWPMHDRLYAARGRLLQTDLVGYAAELGLDAERVGAELRDGVHRERVRRHVDPAAAMGVTGTPAFFANGELHHGSFDVRSLLSALGAA